MRCRQCNWENPSGTNFCLGCGTRLGARIQTEVAGTVSPAAPAFSNRAKPPATPWALVTCVNRDGTDGASRAIDSEWASIGRIGCDIDYPDDRFLAPTHARIGKAEDGFELIPVDTLNGVFWRISEPVPLMDGAVFLAGREVYRIGFTHPRESDPEPLVRDGTAWFGSPVPNAWGRLTQILANGAYGDTRLLVGAEVVIGREEGDIVRREDGFMSRMHAVVTCNGKHVELRDLGSSNGTYLRMDGPLVLPFGHCFRVGDQLLRVDDASD